MGQAGVWAVLHRTREQHVGSCTVISLGAAHCDLCVFSLEPLLDSKPCYWSPHPPQSVGESGAFGEGSQGSGAICWQSDLAGKEKYAKARARNFHANICFIS